MTDEQKKADAVFASWDIWEWGVVHDDDQRVCSECQLKAEAFIRNNGCDIMLCHKHWLMDFRLRRRGNWHYAGVVREPGASHS